MVKLILTILLLIFSLESRADSLDSCIAYESLRKFENIDNKERIKEENSSLSVADVYDINQFYLVSIFGAYFPVPNKFAISGSGAIKGNTLSLFRHGNEYLPNQKRKGLVGQILIGSVTELEKPISSNEDNGRITTLKVFKECVFNDFTIEFLRTELAPTILVVKIIRGNEYLAFTDDNPYLWKYLMRLFEKIYEEKA